MAKNKGWRRAGWFALILTTVISVAVVAAVLNREWLYDFYRGTTYEPSTEMARIRNDLQLTDKGIFLFNAAQPELNESEAFNDHCQSGTEMQVAILGCYTEGNIYVYNVTEKELNGIRELTTAHELLHAVYARMSEQEKLSLQSLLDTVYQKNTATLKEELDTYTEAEKYEELYVRSGTEIADLPEALEDHYAEIFKNQDKIVGFYDSYIAIFREIRAEMESLKAEMESLSVQIDSLTAEYEQRVANLNANITSFNACANVAGCFTSESEFYYQRNTLIAEQEALENTYNTINQLVINYNTLVNQYNEDVTRSEKLNQKINSNTPPEEIK